jgi:hypothetical protein
MTGSQQVWRCGAYRPGHDPNHIPALRSGRPGQQRIPGTVRIVGTDIEFTPLANGTVVLLHNHDLGRVAGFIDAGTEAEYLPRWGILRFQSQTRDRPTISPPPFTAIVSVTTQELSPCGSLAPPGATLAERLMADGGFLVPTSDLDTVEPADLDSSDR